MGKNDKPKPEKDEQDEYAPGTIKGALEAYENVYLPLKRLREEVQEWEAQNDEQNKGK